jgi:D-galactarolactone cycloisomerase
MKIRDIQTWFVRYPVVESHRPFWQRDGVRRSLGDMTVVKVTTEEGLVGWGTCLDPRPENAEKVRTEVAPRFIGRDPSDLHQNSQLLTGLYRAGINAWAIDLALWDILGKSAGLPLSRLLGGVSTRVAPYASLTSGMRPEERKESLQILAAEHFPVAKVHLATSMPINESLRLIEACRKAAGDDLLIAVDSHQGSGALPRWGVQGALTFLHEMDRLGNIAFVEGCLPRDDYHGLKLVAAASATPISFGGPIGEVSLVEMERLLAEDCLDQIQPGAGCNASVWTVHKMCVLCEAHYKNFSPHTWNSLDTVAAMHMAAATTSANYVEWHYDPPNLPVFLANVLLKEPIKLNADGTLDVPQGPGLGVEIDEEALRKYSQ